MSIYKDSERKHERDLARRRGEFRQDSGEWVEVQPTHRITLPRNPTFEALVHEDEVDIEALCLRLYRTSGGKVSKTSGPDLSLYPFVERIEP